MKQIKERIVNWYLTRKTGKDKAQREWEAWYDRNVVWKADTITNMFMHFKHVIEVDYRKFTNPYEPMAWVPCADAKQYFWPQRELDTTCVWRFERVRWDQWDQRWHITDFGECDKIFVATNSDEDAVMIALLYT